MERWQYRQSPHDNGHGRHDVHRRFRTGRLRRGNIGKRGERHLCDWPHLACGERRGILPGVHRRRPVGLYGQRQQRDAICPRYVYRAHGRPLAESGGKITVPVLPFFRQGGGGISAAFSLPPLLEAFIICFYFKPLPLCSYKEYRGSAQRARGLKRPAKARAKSSPLSGGEVARKTEEKGRGLSERSEFRRPRRRLRRRTQKPDNSGGASWFVLLAVEKNEQITQISVTRTFFDRERKSFVAPSSLAVSRSMAGCFCNAKI